jgi:DNA invertase Pin-like site-specific DNA recombinase
MRTYKGSISSNSWDATDLTGARLALYGRASDDHRGAETSVTAQLDFGERWARSRGCTIVDRYCDNDLSASHYATKEREDFKRLVADVDAG